MKKTWLSYPLWLVYAAFTAVSAAAYFSWFSIYVWGMGQNQTAIGICLMFCVIAGIWLAGHGLACWFRGRQARQTGHGIAGRRLAAVLEALLAVGLCMAAVFCRLHLLDRFDGEITGGFFYDIALVRAERVAPAAVHSISCLDALYASFLSFVLSFTGNKVAAGVMMQLVLQVAAIFIFYFAGKFLSGRGEAMCALGLMAFAPGLCKGILSLAPETFYFLLYALGLLLCGLYGKKASCAGTPKEEAGHRKRGYVFAAACGLYIGYAGFLAMAGWTLLVPAAFACRKRQEAEGKAGESRKNAAAVWGHWAACFAASLAAFFLFLWLYASASGCPYGEMFSEWLEHSAQQIAFPKEDMFWKAGAEPFSWMGLLLCLCGSLNIIGFWFGKTQKQDSWIFMLLFFLVFQAVRFGGMDYGIFLTAAEGILAGIGICSMGKRGRNLSLAEENRGSAGRTPPMEGEKRGAADWEMQTEEERCRAAGWEAQAEERHSAAYRGVQMEENRGAAGWKAQMRGENRGAADWETQAEERHGVVDGEAQTEEAGGLPGAMARGMAIQERYLQNGLNIADMPKEEKPKVKLLDNPLPLPKKHVKRVMAYAKDVDGDEMEFDFSVEEDDDFDI